MILSGTIIEDSNTLIEDGSVVVDGSRIVAVGPRNEIVDRYPEHERRTYDLLCPGLVGGYTHAVQSLGRGLADDLEFLDWLFD